ncbi:hypothetical protein CXG81DRAFT_21528, partial [Caulochytrium protostelioides]
VPFDNWLPPDGNQAALPQYWYTPGNHRSHIPTAAGDGYVGRDVELEEYSLPSSQVAFVRHPEEPPNRQASTDNQNQNPFSSPFPRPDLFHFDVNPQKSSGSRLANQPSNSLPISTFHPESFASLNDPIQSPTVGGSVTETGDLAAPLVWKNLPTNNQESSNSWIMQNRGPESFHHDGHLVISSDIQTDEQVSYQLSSPPTTWQAHLEKFPLKIGRTVDFQPDSARAVAAYGLEKSTKSFTKHFVSMTKLKPLGFQDFVYKLFEVIVEPATGMKRHLHPISYVFSAEFVSFSSSSDFASQIDRSKRTDVEDSIASHFARFKDYAELIKTLYHHRWYCNVWKLRIQQAIVDDMVLWLFLSYFVKSDNEHLISEKEKYGMLASWQDGLTHLEKQLNALRAQEETYRLHLIKEFDLNLDSSSDDLRKMIMNFAEPLQEEDSQAAEIVKMLGPDCSAPQIEKAAIASLQRRNVGLNMKSMKDRGLAIKRRPHRCRVFETILHPEVVAKFYRAQHDQDRENFETANEAFKKLVQKSPFSDIELPLKEISPSALDLMDPTPSHLFQLFSVDSRFKACLLNSRISGLVFYPTVPMSSDIDFHHHSLPRASWDV